ncbi:MAG: nucleoside monophosphate kinase [Candidatus Saccharibacteria bacterium]|nr:nucleoside monophosphate kinase [Candidatus Saccharibacteria bacterium]
MIIFFGLAGSGKSVQSSMLSEVIGWRHISAGALLRSQNSQQLQSDMMSGKLVNYQVTNQLMRQVLDEAQDKLIVDGYPRQIEQARWLIDEHRKIDVCFVLDVTVEIIKARLALRGRKDDQETIIDERVKVFENQTLEVVNFFKSNGVKVVHIDGNQTVEQVHQNILKEMKNVFTTK